MKTREEREELEKILKESGERNFSPEDTPELEGISSFDLDFDKLRKECDSKAKKMLKNATGLVLSPEMLKQNPYLKDKMRVDVISLSGMLYQLKVNETMQETLMEEVRSGASHPRMFEVFGQLSKTIADLNKQLLQTVEAIKQTYKGIKGDILEKREELKALGAGDDGLLRNNRGIVSLGTKELIKATKRMKAHSQRDQEIEDVEVE